MEGNACASRRRGVRGRDKKQDVSGLAARQRQFHKQARETRPPQAASPAVGPPAEEEMNRANEQNKVSLSRFSGFPVFLGWAGSFPSPTMPSADFCPPITSPCGGGSLAAGGQISPGNARSPSHLCPPHLRPRLPYRYRALKIIAFSPRRSRLVCGCCSSSQCFACGFLQIPPRGGHPCRAANSSPCRVCRGLAPPSGRAMPGAQ